MASNAQFKSAADDPAVYNRGAILINGISQEIRSGKLRHGQRLSSMRDLAKQYRVSFGVARAAVGQLAEMGLVRKSRGSGAYVTYLAKDVNCMNTVYLMLNSKDHLYDHLAANLVSYLHGKGLQAVTMAWDRTGGLKQFSNMFNWWREEPPKAVVTQWEIPKLDEAISNFRDEQTRIIATFRSPADIPEDWSAVVSDWGHAVKIAIRHLLKLGHKRIGLVMPKVPGYKDKKCSSAVRARLDQRHLVHSAREALRPEGLEGGLCVHINEPVDDGGCEALAEPNLRRMKKWLSQKDRPSAIVGQDSRMVAAKRAAEQLGLRVPEDISLIGLGNTPWAEASDLSSVWMHEDIIAQRIGELIVADEDMFFNTSRHLFVTPELICRGSCRSHNFPDGG